MSNLTGLSENECAFIAFATSALRSDAPNFNFGRIAEFGQKSGVLDRAEARKLAWRSRFPDWANQRLAVEFNATDRPEIVPDTISTGFNRMTVEHTPAQVLAGSRLPHHMSKLNSWNPAIEIFHGRETWHNFINFSELSWTKNGVVRPLANKANTHLIDALEGTAPVELGGTTFLGMVPGSTIYVHWLLDMFPRLLLLNREIDIGTKIDHFLFTSCTSGFQKHSLERLGIPLEKIKTRHADGPFYYCDAYYYVSDIRNECTTHPDIYREVADFFFEPTYPRARSNRLYISRNRGTKRIIENEAELLPHLEERGFQTIYAEDYSVAEMSALLNKVECVVTPHGAGLANLIFLPPSARVLEIYSTHLSRDYWRMSDQMGLDYFAYQARGPKGVELSDEYIDRMTAAEQNSCNIWMDLDRFLPALDSIL